MPAPAIAGDYPLQIHPVDISAYKAGNTGIDYAWTFDSGRPGPHVMINAVIHGNELCGAIAVDLLFREGVRPKAGKLSLSDRAFVDTQAVLTVIERIVARIGRRIDESSPMVDARLPDGSRVNAIIPPISIKGPCLTIRKFTKESLTVDDLVMKTTLTPEMSDFLSVCVKYRQSIVISGGTGSGKTTTLNVLSGFIPEEERIVTIEDAAELKLTQPHIVSLETRPPNLEQRGEVTIRDLV